MNNSIILLFLFLSVDKFRWGLCAAPSRGAFVDLIDSDVTLGNGLFNITFYANATAKSLYKNEVNLIDNIDKHMQTWYLDWNGERAYFNPSKVEIVSNESEIAHVNYIQDGADELYIEFHLVVLPDVSGLYQYVKISNPTGEIVDLAEFRTVHRFDHALMPKVTNIIRSGETPDLWDRPQIHDTTWQLADGTYWSKYDFCGYIRETPWYGVYGGGFGGWIISASKEYHSAGPLKQELLVHHDSLMLNYFQSSHFGTPNMEAPPGWAKFYGPVLIYINSGSEEEVQADAARQAVAEQQKWPYSWVNETDYPLNRGSVSGQITGQTKAMVIVYDYLEQEFDVQTLGYLYYSETDENGTFTIDNIRPGDYQILAYPLAGHGSDSLARKNITILEGNQNIETLDLPEPTNIIWSLGETNRRSDIYRYSDEQRNFYWHLLPPANLTFEMGKSNVNKDWYYAQTRSPGIWNIVYTDAPDGNNRTLRIAFAAASNSSSVQVDVNDQFIGHFTYENDKTLYRDALQSGNFHAEKVTVPSDYVVEGENRVSFVLLEGMVMYDAISMANGDN